MIARRIFLAGMVLFAWHCSSQTVKKRDLGKAKTASEVGATDEDLDAKVEPQVNPNPGDPIVGQPPAPPASTTDH